MRKGKRVGIRWNGDPVPTPKKLNQKFFRGGPVENSFLILRREGKEGGKIYSLRNVERGKIYSR